MKRHLLLQGLFLVATSCLANVAAQACSTSSQCPSSSPCCSATGVCGSGAIACAGGCQPMASFSGSSCLPNPICTDKNITFKPSDYKNADVFRPILLYDGNSSAAPFTLDYGFLGAGPEGVLLELTAPTQTKISSTEYVLFGNIELTARHTAIDGLVFAFITMSDIKDEIDNEQTASDGQVIYTNFFSEAQTVSGSSATINGGSKFNVADWHTYGINWQSDKLQWTIDGTVVKTITAKSVGNNYPRSPSRVQVSVWAGGNSTNTQGVIDWSGGAIDWTNSNYTDTGYYSAEIKSFAVNCASQKVTGLNTTGNGTAPTSWIYTGQIAASLDEPQFMLSTDPITFLTNTSAGGSTSLPGYNLQSAFTLSNDNAWDGSGNTSGLTITTTKSKSSTTSTKTNGSKNTSTSTGSTTIGSKSSNNDSSTSKGWLANNKALSIAVPIAAGAVGLIAIWAIVVACMKRRRRSRNNTLKRADLNKLGFNSAAVMNIASDSRKSSAYSKIEDDDEEEEEADVVATMEGGQRYGAGYAPSPKKRDYANSRTNLHDNRRYGNGNADVSYDSAYDMINRVTSPVSVQHSSAGVRGPYTPAVNVYTPAINQTPALRNYQQQGAAVYTTPSYNMTRQYPLPATSSQYRNAAVAAGPPPLQQDYQQQHSYQQRLYQEQGYPNQPHQQQQQRYFYSQAQGPYRNP